MERLGEGSAFNTERHALNSGQKLTVKDEFKLKVQELLKTKNYFQNSRFCYQLRLCLDKELVNLSERDTYFISGIVSNRKKACRSLR